MPLLSIILLILSIKSCVDYRSVVKERDEIIKGTNLMMESFDYSLKLNNLLYDNSKLNDSLKIESINLMDSLKLYGDSSMYIFDKHKK